MGNYNNKQKPKKTNTMAQTTLLPGVESISGKVGNYLFKTYTRNGKKEVRVYLCPEGSYRRQSKLSAGERAARMQFAEQAREVSRRMKDGDRRTKKEIWKEVKSEMKGEKTWKE